MRKFMLFMVKFSKLVSQMLFHHQHGEKNCRSSSSTSESGVMDEPADDEHVG